MYQFRLANIMGLDTKSIQHSAGITEALIGIEDPEAFLEYCRDHKEGIEYQTKPERLDTLATRYKKIQALAALPHDIADTFTAGIISKIKTAKSVIRDQIDAGNQRPFSTIKLEGEKYFTKKEINALGGLKCSPATILEMYDQNKLQGELYKLYMSKFSVRKKYDLLSDNQKRVKNLIPQGITA